MSEFISNIISGIGNMPLWAVLAFAFISAVVQQFFPPYPSDSLLLVLGALAARHVIPVFSVISMYVLGTLISSYAVFYITGKLGKPLLGNRYIKKIFPEKYQKRAKMFIEKYGPAALAICRFLPGVNSVCLIVAGIMGLHGFAANVCIGCAAAAENFIYFGAGMLIGGGVLPIVLSSGKLGAAIAVAAVVGAVAFLLINHARVLKKNKSISK